jgi:cytoskeletal protein CcmA (bactofilin family)
MVTSSTSESKGFGLGNLVSSRFSGESYTSEPSYSSEKYSSVGGSVRPVITEDVEIKGELAFSGELEFNGRFEGQLKSGGSLTVGESALIKGTLNAESAVIAGKIQGDITATGKIHLRPEAMVFGDIRAKVIVIEEGALVDGKILITDTDRPSPDFDNMFSRVSSGSSKTYSSKSNISITSASSSGSSS